MSRPEGALDVGGLSIPGATKRATAHEASAAHRARRFVASVATGPVDCARLLDMLGLVPDGTELTVRVP